MKTDIDEILSQRGGKRNLTTNLIEDAPEAWEGCIHLDCLPECWPSEWHCERLAIFMRENGISRQPYKPEVQEERMAYDLPPNHDGSDEVL